MRTWHLALALAPVAALVLAVSSVGQPIQTTGTPSGGWEVETSGSEKDGITRPFTVTLDIKCKDGNGGSLEVKVTHTFSTGTLDTDIAAILGFLLQQEDYHGKDITIEVKDTKITVKGTDLVGLSELVQKGGGTPSQEGKGQLKIKSIKGVPHTKPSGTTFLELNVTGGNRRDGTELVIGGAGLPAFPPPPPDPTDLAVGQAIQVEIVSCEIPAGLTGGQVLDFVQARLTRAGWVVQRTATGLRLVSILASVGPVHPSVIWIEPTGESDYLWELTAFDQ